MSARHKPTTAISTTGAWDPSQPLPDPFHERFIQFALTHPHMANAKIYEMASGEAPHPEHRSSATLILRRPEVAARYRWLQQEESKRCAMTRDQLRRFLEAVISTPPSELSADSKLAQKITYHDNGQPRVIEMPDKLRAAALLSEMNGWTMPEGTEFLSDAAAVVFNIIRNKSRRRGDRNGEPIDV